MVFFLFARNFDVAGVIGEAFAHNIFLFVFLFVLFALFIIGMILICDEETPVGCWSVFGRVPMRRIAV
jgi:hypothetical protein